MIISIYIYSVNFTSEKLFDRTLVRRARDGTEKTRHKPRFFTPQRFDLMTEILYN